ncbi:unnamed protein product [Lampetra fluviatilis]
MDAVFVSKLDRKFGVMRRGGAPTPPRHREGPLASVVNTAARTKTAPPTPDETRATSSGRGTAEGSIHHPGGFHSVKCLIFDARNTADDANGNKEEQRIACVVLL